MESGRIDFEALTSFPDVRQFLGDALCSELVGDADKLMKCHRAHLDKWLNPEEILQYWNEHQSEMGSWAGAAPKVALLLPNSCLAERGGSIVRARISEQQGAMLDETFETCCRLAYRYAEERDQKKKKKKMKKSGILTFWRRRLEKVREILKSQNMRKKKSQILQKRTATRTKY